MIKIIRLWTFEFKGIQFKAWSGKDGYTFNVLQKEKPITICK